MILHSQSSSSPLFDTSLTHEILYKLDYFLTMNIQIFCNRFNISNDYSSIKETSTTQ